MFSILVTSQNDPCDWEIFWLSYWRIQGLGHHQWCLLISPWYRASAATLSTNPLAHFPLIQGICSHTVNQSTCSFPLDTGHLQPHCQPIHLLISPWYRASAATLSTNPLAHFPLIQGICSHTVNQSTCSFPLDTGHLQPHCQPIHLLISPWYRASAATLSTNPLAHFPLIQGICSHTVNQSTCSFPLDTGHLQPHCQPIHLLISPWYRASAATLSTNPLAHFPLIQGICSHTVNQSICSFPLDTGHLQPHCQPIHLLISPWYRASAATLSTNPLAHFTQESDIMCVPSHSYFAIINIQRDKQDTTLLVCPNQMKSSTRVTLDKKQAYCEKKVNRRLHFIWVEWQIIRRRINSYMSTLIFRCLPK